MLEKLGLKRSTYYYLRSHPREDAYADVRPLVREIFSRTPNGMGYRQVRMALRAEQGLSISGKTVLRLMREEGCVCRIRRRRYASYRGKVGKAAENVLNREFSADAPMTKLATDVTEFNVAGAKAYLSPVMDLFNNEIVAFSISRNPNMAQIDEMMGQLASLEFGESPLLHSDQGWQYQQISYQRKLEELGVVQSMSRKATCLDNACMEGFFGHMKDEFFIWPQVPLVRVVQSRADRIHPLLEQRPVPGRIKRNDPGRIPRPFSWVRLRTLFNRPTFGV